MAWKIWSIGVLLAASSALAQEGSEVFTKSSNDSLLWGPYKPNLYFGVRPRIPKSLTTALLWARVEDFSKVQNSIRHTCEQNDGMAGYGWDSYDPRSGGIQTIHDTGNGIDLETSFVKLDSGAWAARVKGTPREDAEPQGGSQGGIQTLKSAVWLNVGLEGLGSLEVRDAESGEEAGFEGDVVIEGQSTDLGDFVLKVTEPSSNSHPMHSHASYQAKPLDHTLVHSLQIQEEALWQAKPILFSSMKSTIDGYVEEYTTEKMPPPWQTYTIQNNPGQGNSHLVQKVFEGAFEFDMIFASASQESSITAESIGERISEVQKSFDDKYLQVLKPQAPFTASKYIPFAKSLFSNLIGGIGYFQGDQVIDRSYASEYDEESEGFWIETAEARGRNQQKVEGPYELYTAIPSRPFFPRGFLWDEGFHLLPILDWDPELVMQILSSWFNLMDEDGWIGREQILGNEARSKVPGEFQVQYPHYANPPTLFMVLESILDKADVGSGATNSAQKPLTPASYDSKATKQWFRTLYPLLKRHFAWYRRTQIGDLKSYDGRGDAPSQKEAYRWRGRSERHVLTSGLDDYPRPQPPHPGELHTDLISWIGMLSRAMTRIAGYLDEIEDEASFTKITQAIKKNVDALHWDAKAKTYCDATVDEYEESVHVCHKGYISIFPFMTGLMGPKHEHLGAVLDLIADEEELWSPFGIRSLSLKDEFYGTDENYWRGPVWMPLNYLIVKELLSLAHTSGPHQKRAATMYTALRSNLVNTIYNSWEETGFAWEQYNPETGKGQRTQHFTGWTSLIVKVIAMPDLSGKKGGRDEL
ncbi:hypothetical protein B0A48_15403 [Cryoendolithus antarcticus]|uniref:Mannosyl-oligosaccharide glucosidase n=1 Tax=Cryoendolithus antarcticus TaxID=1507870 RepID=A0A1V8SI74_9PEZI|nr:hypothetical protein B0A48_15403 [Cryoendolithus antarcticus]